MSYYKDNETVYIYIYINQFSNYSKKKEEKKSVSTKTTQSALTRISFYSIITLEI